MQSGYHTHEAVPLHAETLCRCARRGIRRITDLSIDEALAHVEGGAEVGLGWTTAAAAAAGRIMRTRSAGLSPCMGTPSALMHGNLVCEELPA